MARAPEVTWERLFETFGSDTGIGFGESYIPALQIKRWNPSPVSVQVLKPLPGFKRKCHFFSHSEWYLGLLFSWAGAHVREQFPLWPWEHYHPEYSRNPEVDSMLPQSVGMQAICREVGVKHGVFVGTNIPYIWSIDLCLHMPWVADMKKSTCLISIKPLSSEKYLYVDPLHRGVEKLECERRYANKIGINYFTGDRTLYPGPIFSNLEMLADAAILPIQHPWSYTLQRFLDQHGDAAKNEPLESIRGRLIADYKCSPEQASFTKNHILWNQFVDCDLSFDLKESIPSRKGGRAIRQAIRNSLAGVTR